MDEETAEKKDDDRRFDGMLSPHMQDGEFGVKGFEDSGDTDRAAWAG